MAARERDFTAPTVQLLTPTGELRPTPEAEAYLPIVEALPDTTLERLYRDMMVSRRIDIAGANLQRQGQLALWVPSHGQEAAQVGSAHAARPQDHIFPSYREHIVGIIRGLDPVNILALLRGATLGGWNIAVSSYSPNPEVATELVMFMTATESQKAMALKLSHLPTIISLYDDADIAAQQSLIPRWKEIFLNAVPRPSAPTKVAYNEVSSKFWTAVHQTLSGTGSAAENLEILQIELEEMKGGGW